MQKQRSFEQVWLLLSTGWFATRELTKLVGCHKVNFLNVASRKKVKPAAGPHEREHRLDNKTSYQNESTT